MLRVLQIGMSWDYGGIESVIINYYRNIDRNKVQFDFLCPYKHLAYEKEIIDLGGRLIHICDFHRSPLAYYKELLVILRHYSVVHIHMLSGANILPLVAAKKAGVKTIIAHSHNTQAEDKFRAILHVVNHNRIKELATVLIGCSDEAGKWLFNSNEFLILRNAINTAKYVYSVNNRSEVRDKLNIASDTFVIGNVGRLNVQKNHLFLIKTFKYILRLIPNSKLILIGDGEQKKKIEETIKLYELDEFVIFAGIIHDVEKYYSAMDILVMPSLYEGLPVTLVEAQANGLKCIVSDSIPRDCKISESLSFLSLSLGEKSWAKHICKIDIARNQQAQKQVTDSGFDIKNQTKLLEHIYLGKPGVQH